MASSGNIRNSDWEGNEELKLDLQRYVLQNLKRREILYFVQKDFPEYARMDQRSRKRQGNALFERSEPGGLIHEDDLDFKSFLY